MAYILNIETATDISSICISQEEKVLAVKESQDSMAHARVTTTLIDACLQELGITMSELSAVAVSSGPGSYTALRVGSSVAKGICYAMDIPLISVSTLEALALASSKLQTGDVYCPMIDARRKEVYTALYNNTLTEVNPCSAEILTPAFIEALALNNSVVFSGNGTPKLEEMVDNSAFHFTPVRCAAAYLAPLSQIALREKNYENIAYFEPTYLKPPNITISKKRLL